MDDEFEKGLSDENQPCLNCLIYDNDCKCLFLNDTWFRRGLLESSGPLDYKPERSNAENDT